MSIQKMSHMQLLKEGLPYVTLPNNVLQNLKNTDALALWCYLQSLPDQWVVIKSNIQKHFGFGKAKSKEVFSILKKHNLIEYIHERNEKGQTVKVHLIVKNGVDFIPNINPTTTGTETIPMDLTTGTEIVPHDKQPPINTIVNKKENNKKEKNIIKKEKKLKPVEYQETLYMQEESPSKALSVSQLSSENPYNVPTEMIEDFLKVRRAKRAPLTKTAWKGILSELKKCQEKGFDPIEAFAIMVTAGWQALNADWIAKYKNQNKAPTESYYDNVSHPRINRPGRIF